MVTLCSVFLLVCLNLRPQRWQEEPEEGGKRGHPESPDILWPYNVPKEGYSSETSRLCSPDSPGLKWLLGLGTKTLGP